MVALDLWTIDEIVRARWIHLDSKTDPVNIDKAWEPLNEYPRVICDGCGDIDDNKLPQQIKVNDLVIRSPCEIFRALNGLIIVKERVKDLLLKLVGEQAHWGKCQVINESGKTVSLQKPGRKCFG